MFEWADQILHWLKQIPTGVDALAIPSGIVYVLLNRRARHRLRNARLAVALLEELYYTRKRFSELIDSAVAMEKSPQASGQQDFEPGSYRFLSLHSVYDGLVSSSNITYFDRDTQRLLHYVYSGIQWFGKDADQITRASAMRWVINDKELANGTLDNMDDVIRVVEAFRDRNLCKGRWCPILKAIGLAYDV